MDLLFVLTAACALGSGLVAGVFFAFSSFVMKALGRLSPEQGIGAMQSINLAVINPLFLGVFLGTAGGCAILGIWSLRTWPQPGAGWVPAGCVLYLLGATLVTFACNVPRNNALAAVEAASPAGAGVWSGYLIGWTAWNHVRTVAALAAAAVLTIACAIR